MQQLPAILRQQRATVGTTRAVLYRKFCFEVIDAVADLVPIIKPQVAFLNNLALKGWCLSTRWSSMRKKKD